MGYSLIGGMLFQTGDCSVFRDFKIETGDYYRQHKSMIDFEVKIYENKSVRTYENLINFSKAYNCKAELSDDFIKKLISNQQIIFGADFVKSARQVSLEVLKMIDTDENLKENCR